MEFSKQEVAAVQEASASVEQEVTVLRELELCLVGGGLGDITLG